MTDREKLIEILGGMSGIAWSPSVRGIIADHLLANGVTVQNRFHQSVASKPMTNADSIRAMNDEQLSMFLWHFDREELARESDCVITRAQIIKWLQQPAKEAT